MLYRGEYSKAASTVSIALSENCTTDTIPIVSTLIFENADFDVQDDVFYLACALLTRAYCGEHFEVAKHNLKAEFAVAIQKMIPGLSTVAPIDRAHHALATAELDIACWPSSVPTFVPPHGGDVMMIGVNWSGDPVHLRRRSSAGYVQGRYFTNAHLIADPTTISIAIGLMHGGIRCRNLYVPLAAGLTPESFEAISEALADVGIHLAMLPV
jgi:hypothetical protein